MIEETLLRISNGETERSIMRLPHMPDWITWCNYKQKHFKDEDFIGRLLRAKEDYCQVKEDELHELANNRERDVLHYTEVTEGPKGTTIKKGVTSDNTSVNRDKLIADVTWRTLRTSMPKKYGDKVQQEVSAPGGQPFQPVLNITIKKIEDDE